MQWSEGSGEVQELCILIICNVYFTGAEEYKEKAIQFKTNHTPQEVKGSRGNTCSVLSGHPVYTAGIRATRAMAGKASAGGWI